MPGTFDDISQSASARRGRRLLVPVLLALVLMAGSVFAVDRERAGVRAELDGASDFAAFGSAVRTLEHQSEAVAGSPTSWRAAQPSLQPAVQAMQRTAQETSVSEMPAIGSLYQAALGAQRRLDAAALTGSGWQPAADALFGAELSLRTAIAAEQDRRLAQARSELARADRLAGLTHAGTMLLLLVFAAAMVLGDRRASRSRLAAISASERRLQDILDQSPAAIYLTDLAGRYTLVNRAWEKATGRTRAETLGRLPTEIWSPDAAAGHQARQAEAIRTEQTVEHLVPSPVGDGRVFLDSRFLLRDDGGQPYGVGGVATDVTEQLEAQERERLLATVVTSATDAILTVRDGVITSWNPAAERLLGRPAGLAGVAWHQLAGQAERQQLESLLEAGRAAPVLGHETVLQGAGGLPLPVALTITALDGGDDGTLSVVVHDIGQEQRHRAELIRQARRDALTGLVNRLGFNEALETHIAGGPGSSPGALLLVDLDHFKLVNDTFGHAAGDELLTHVARRLSDGAGEAALVARLGGDEFAVLCPDVGSAWDGMERADRIRALVARPAEILNAGTLSISASVGVRLGPIEEAGRWLQEADVAMYAAKRAGRDRSVLFTAAEGEAAVTEQHLRQDLREAVSNGELTVHYQPVVDLATGRPSGVEALCRWQHPQRGLIQPDLFIGLAEDTGLIAEVGLHVWRESVRQLLAWEAAGRADLHLAVNVSVRQLGDDQFLEAVADTLRRFPQLRGRVMVEITESALAEQSLLPMLTRLREAGALLAIDDFGTGYSALSYLSLFPIDCLKIDKSFLDGLAGSSDALAVLRTVLQLADTLGMATVAEGIEDGPTAALVSAAGCDRAQGHHWSPAVPAADLPATLDRLDQQAHGAPAASERPLRPRRTRRAEPAVVARVLQLHAAGASRHTIAAILNKEDVPTGTGRRWHAASIGALLSHRVDDVADA